MSVPPALAAILTALILLCATQKTAAQDVSAEALIGADRITIWQADRTTPVVKRGTVVDLTGDRVEFRREGSRSLESIPLADITTLQYPYSPSFSAGLRKAASGEFADAVVSFRMAAETEPREWVRREILGHLARTALRVRDAATATDAVREILESDPRSRHVAWLPVVWDDRKELNPADRQRFVRQLGSASRLDQLVAASHLLLDEEHRVEARRVFEQLQLQGYRPTQLLAETQLWREKLAREQPLEDFEIQSWQDQIDQLPLELRHGPRFLLGRAYLRRHEYRNAAIAFLWTPMLSPDRSDLAQTAMIDAVEALRLAGQPREAARIEAELQAVYGR